jgi:hypothetical protein
MSPKFSSTAGRNKLLQEKVKPKDNCEVISNISASTSTTEWKFIRWRKLIFTNNQPGKTLSPGRGHFLY